MRAWPKVLKKDVCSLNNWLYNNENTILAEETDYVKYYSDLFSRVATLMSPLRSLLKRSSQLPSGRLVAAKEYRPFGKR